MKINFTRKFVPAAQTLQILRKAWLIKMRILSEALGYVMYFCYYLVHNYGLAIILFTLISKIVLLPVSVWVQKNSIKMVKMQPEINRIKAKHFGDADRIADEQSQIFKREKYNPLASLIPLAVQIILLMGLVEVIYHPLDYLLHMSQDVITAFNGLAISLAGVHPESSSVQLTVVEMIKSGTGASYFLRGNPAWKQQRQWFCIQGDPYQRKSSPCGGMSGKRCQRLIGSKPGVTGTGTEP